MKAQFFNRHNAADPLNGTTLDGPEALPRLLSALKDRDPFMAELIGTNGQTLLLGIGWPEGCVQLSSTEGDPPYWVALRGGADLAGGELTFWLGNELTPVRRRHGLPMTVVAEIAAEFLRTGERDSAWTGKRSDLITAPSHAHAPQERSPGGPGRVLAKWRAWGKVPLCPQALPPHRFGFSPGSY